MMLSKPVSLILLALAAFLSSTLQTTRSPPSPTLRTTQSSLNRRAKISRCTADQTSIIRYTLRRVIRWAKDGAHGVSDIGIERPWPEYSPFQGFCRRRFQYHFKQNNEFTRRALYERLVAIEQEGRDTPVDAKVPILCFDVEQKCNGVRPAYVDDTLSMVVIVCACFTFHPVSR